MEAEDLCEICGGDGGSDSDSDCCSAGDGPGCTDATCADAVCNQDPFCCEEQWDGICAVEAQELCEVCVAGGGGNSDCCDASDAPGCSDAGCTAAVCDQDAFCCDATWDDLCAEQAQDLCDICQAGGGGGGGSDSDCCGAGDGVGCSEPACAAVVCDQDAFCCDAAWDEICASEAQELCEVCQGGGPAPTNDCCATSPTAGCADGGCQSAVCAQDPFCCDPQWDFICAQEAADLCGCEATSGDA